MGSCINTMEKMKGIRVPAKEDVDLFLRIVSAFLGLMFLMGALWASRDGRYLNITALYSAMAMFVCGMSPARPSPVALIVLTISTVLAGFDFVSRALPGLRDEGYPLDIVIFYLAEFVVIAWFFIKNLDAILAKNKVTEQHGQTIGDRPRFCVRDFSVLSKPWSAPDSQAELKGPGSIFLTANGSAQILR